MKVYVYILTKNNLKERRFEALEIISNYSYYFINPYSEKDYCPGEFINVVGIFFVFYFLKPLNFIQKRKLLKIAKQRSLNENS